MIDDSEDTFDFDGLQSSLEQANVAINEFIDDTLGPLVENTPLGDLVSTGNEEQPPFTDDPDNVGIFNPGQFVFDLFG